MKTVVKYNQPSKIDRRRAACHDARVYLGEDKFQQLTTYLQQIYQIKGIRACFNASYFMCGIAGVEGRLPIQGIISFALAQSE